MKPLLPLSVGGSVLGILLMIMRKCTGGKLSSRFYYRAWLLVLLLLQLMLLLHWFLFASLMNWIHLPQVQKDLA